MTREKLLSYPFLKRYVQVVLLLVLVLVLCSSWEDGSVAWGHLRHVSGDVAWRLLALTMLLGLLRKLFPAARWSVLVLPLRKYTGLFAAVFACVHVVAVYMKVVAAGAPLGAYFFRVFEPGNAMLLGWLGFLALVPPLVTSTRRAIRWLHHNRWKFIQRFAHVAFVFAALHFMFAVYYSVGTVAIEPSVALVVYVACYSYLYVKKQVYV